MTKIQVYDPALCCSTGICGVGVDQEKVTFAADVDWLKSQGGQIERFNLAQQPMAFAENPVVKGFLVRSGAEALPLILVDGEVALAGRYPHRMELAKWANISLIATDTKQGRRLLRWKSLLLNPFLKEYDMMKFLDQLPNFLFFHGEGWSWQNFTCMRHRCSTC